jgi:hypothetical protein
MSADPLELSAASLEELERTFQELLFLLTLDGLEDELEAFLVSFLSPFNKGACKGAGLSVGLVSVCRLSWSDESFLLLCEDDDLSEAFTGSFTVFKSSLIGSWMLCGGVVTSSFVCLGCF